jgi:hypothetical protein
LLFAVFLIAFWLFWKGYIGMTIMVALALSQLWRAYSEQLRADFRGRQGFTLYQGMALIGVLLSSVFVFTYRESSQLANVASAKLGWSAVLHVEVVLISQLLALAIVLYMGRSSITSSRLEMFLHESAKK